MKALKFIILALLVASCGQENEVEKSETTDGVVTVTKYKVVGTNFCHDVEKYVIDGHEYLVFSSKIANPPTVVHSEACPCKK